MVAMAAAHPIGVAAVGPAVAAGRPGGHQLGRRAERGEGEAGRDALGHADDVGLDPVVLDREHPPGAAEAGLDLVGDEQDAVLPAELDESLQEPRRRGHVAPLAQHRLEDHGRGLVGRGLGLEEVLHADQAPVDLGLRVRREGIGERRHEHAGGERLVTRPVRRLRGGHGHGQVGAAVEAAAEHDDVRALGDLLGQLHGRLGDLGTAVGVEERVDGTGRQLGEPGRERLEQVVAVHVHLGVDEAAGLLTDRGHDVRVAVARWT